MKKAVILLFFSLFTTPVSAGMDWKPLSRSIMYVRLDEIAEQMQEAKKSSQKGLSRERIEEIKSKAESVLEGGAMVYVGSIIIGEDK